MKLPIIVLLALLSTTVSAAPEQTFPYTVHTEGESFSLSVHKIKGMEYNASWVYEYVTCDTTYYDYDVSVRTCTSAPLGDIGPYSLESNFCTSNCVLATTPAGVTEVDVKIKKSKGGICLVVRASGIDSNLSCLSYKP